MRYFIRSIKYFLYFNILAGLIISILVLAGMSGYDGQSIASIFAQGYRSLLYIEVFFLICAIAYPAYGFATREVITIGHEIPATKNIIKEYMAQQRFSLTYEDERVIEYRFDGIAGRISRMFEDKIRFVVGDEAFTVTGPRKDIVRFAGIIEYKIQRND